MSPNYTPNVIIFGEAGVGKSSVVNLVLDADKAQVSADAKAYNPDPNMLYEVTIDKKRYNLYDIDEASAETLGRDDGIANLYKLVCGLYESGGVNLLVFVVKCGRLSRNGQKNYHLFNDAFCKGKVPVVIIVTHCENVERMDSWWDENQSRFERAKMTFRGHACVCAYRGRKITKKIHSNDQLSNESNGKVEIPQELYSNHDLFQHSKSQVRELIKTCCPPTGWRPTGWRLTDWRPVDWRLTGWREKSPSNVWFKKMLESSAEKVKLKKTMPDAYKSLNKRFLGYSSSPAKFHLHIKASQSRKPVDEQ